MRAIKLIASDVDGTLLNSQQKLTDGTRSALKRAANAGIQVCHTHAASGLLFAPKLGATVLLSQLKFVQCAQRRSLLGCICQ